MDCGDCVLFTLMVHQFQDEIVVKINGSKIR
jgi:hypothetical protein